MSLEATVEIPFGSMYKYEVDKSSGQLTVDRPLPTPIPYNYGYFEGTLCGDGDPLDVCILGMHPIQPLAKVKIKMIGALVCDDNGYADDKILAVVERDSFFEGFVDHAVEAVMNYLSTYKDGFTILARVDEAEAMKIYSESVEGLARAAGRV